MEIRMLNLLLRELFGKYDFNPWANLFSIIALN